MNKKVLIGLELFRQGPYLTGMRKRLCFLLICWLPCFVMAANVMSLHMAMAEQFAAPTMQMTADMPCHHMAAHASDSQHMHDYVAQQGSVKHACTVCGFCMVSAGAARIDQTPALLLMPQASSTPLYHADPVHSLSYPPAIKPPIFA